jgi:hypothetical protein
MLSQVNEKLINSENQDNPIKSNTLKDTDILEFENSSLDTTNIKSIL